MKKICTMLLLCAVVLSSCGNPAQTVESSSVSSPNQSSIPDLVAPEESDAISSEPISNSEASKPAPAVDVKTFKISVTDLVEILRKDFSNTDLPNAFESEPVINEDSDEYLGETITYTFSIGSGASCNIFALKASEEVYSLQLFAVPSMVDVETAKTFGSYEAQIIASFEPDVETLKRVDLELAITNTPTGSYSSNRSKGTICKFAYLVDEDTTMLMISPK